MNARQLAGIERHAHALRREELGRLLDDLARLGGRLLARLKRTHTFTTAEGDAHPSARPPCAAAP